MSALTPFILPFLLGLVAFLYASVGHGGASGHLAMLSLFGIAQVYQKSSSLILNIVVSIIAFIQFHRSGYFKWRLFIPFAVASIPFAFMGGLIKVRPHFYQQILAVCLIFPIARLMGFFDKGAIEIKPVRTIPALCIGAAIGFLSGLIGMGGGILLTPVLILLNWATIKEAAAVSALFILVNSISGIAALWSHGIQLEPQILVWLASAFVGGWLGAYYGSKKYKLTTMRYVLACVLFIACIKLFLG